ncbi:MAG: peptide chain release factor-like protein [Pseudomonadota bacterium]
MKFREKDVAVERLKGSGPGGQRRNKRETGVRLTHGPTGIVVSATEERSQALNLLIARRRLEERLTKLFRKRKKRIPTVVSRAARARRLEGKRAHSQTKAMRKPVSAED